MRRLFCIWNRSYKARYVVATDIEEALKIARDTGHTRRGFRKWRDCSDAADAKIDGNSPAMTEMALGYGKSGVARLDPSHGWLIGDEPTWEQSEG